MHRYFLLQIRDWLTVEEEMLRKQAVVVGDVGEIMEALDKQMVSRLSSPCMTHLFTLEIKVLCMKRTVAF